MCHVSVHLGAGRERARSSLGMWMDWICTLVSALPHFRHRFNQQGIQTYGREIRPGGEQDHVEGTYVPQNVFLYT